MYFTLYFLQAIPYTNDAQSVPSFSTYTVRSFFFDLPFFVVISVIGRSVITAILINRFSELRGERVSTPFLPLILSASVQCV